jgi:hypothetical protein
MCFGVIKFGPMAEQGTRAEEQQEVEVGFAMSV